MVELLLNTAHKGPSQACCTFQLPELLGALHGLEPDNIQNHDGGVYRGDSRHVNSRSALVSQRAISQRR